MRVGDETKRKGTKVPSGEKAVGKHQKGGHRPRPGTSSTFVTILQVVRSLIHKMGCLFSKENRQKSRATLYEVQVSACVTRRSHPTQCRKTDYTKGKRERPHKLPLTPPLNTTTQRQDSAPNTPVKPPAPGKTPSGSRSAATAPAAAKPAPAASKAAPLPKPKLDPRDFIFLKRKGEKLVKAPGTINGQQFVIDSCEDCEIYVLDMCDSLMIDDCSNCKIVVGPTTVGGGGGHSTRAYYGAGGRGPELNPRP